MSERPVAGIVLAAGLGSRFGDSPKMLALHDGEPFVRRAVKTALGAGLAPVIVVTGNLKAEIEAALADQDVMFAHNPAFRDGMAGSVRTGFSALPAGCAGAVLLLGDMPGIGSDLVTRLVAAWREAGEPAALVPVHDGRRGNPVLLSAALRDRIAELEGDRGAGPLLRSLPDVLEWPAADPAIHLDVDTPDEYARLPSREG